MCLLASGFDSKTSLLWVSSSCAGREEQGAEWSPHSPKGNGQWLATLLRHKCMGTDGIHSRVLRAARSVHQAIFHHLPTLLANLEGPVTWRATNVTPIYKDGQKDTRRRRNTGLWAWPQCRGKSWHRSPIGCHHTEHEWQQEDHAQSAWL